jgi:hypothetical protein
MKRLIVFTLAMVLMVGCEYRALNVLTSDQKLKSIPNVSWVWITSSTIDPTPKWKVQLTIKTNCGIVEVKKEGYTLQGTIEAAVEAAKCVQKCK